MNRMIVSIHQPNFFPWLGYFDKIVRSDIFIILDSVQFPKTNGTWINRVKLISSGEPRWISAEVDRSYHGVRKINEMNFTKTQVWQQKMIGTLISNYKKAPFFKEMFPFFEGLILHNNTNVAEYNSNIITSIAAMLSINNEKLHWSSKIDHVGSSNELLISLTKEMGGNVYMCGGGADSYQDESIFIHSNIELHRQNFLHPTYLQQTDSFHPGLSIIDAAMNIGWGGLKKILDIS
jgi:hypothetical protein